MKRDEKTNGELFRNLFRSEINSVSPQEIFSLKSPFCKPLQTPMFIFRIYLST